MSLFGKIGVVGAAVSFARSGRGQQMIKDARVRYDTPENRERLRQGVGQATQQVKRASQKRTG